MARVDDVAGMGADGGWRSGMRIWWRCTRWPSNSASTSLVEVHDEAELERAMAVGATLVGVNQRDLVTFEVDTERAVRVAAAMPAGVVRVAESGIRGAADAAPPGGGRLSTPCWWASPW